MTAVEFITVLLITLGIIVLSFVAGLKLAGYYYRTAEQEREYALQKQFVRIKANADADDPVGPYVPRQKYQLPPEFEERLRENGRATASLNSNHNILSLITSRYPPG